MKPASLCYNGDTLFGDIAIHVEQGAKQNATYTFRLQICFEEVVEYGECAGKVNWLRLRYNGEDPALVWVVQKKDGDVVFGPEMVNPGDEFEFSGTYKVKPWHEATFWTEIQVFWDSKMVEIHTSCSSPIGPGLVAEDFVVVDGTSKDGGRLPPLT